MTGHRKKLIEVALPLDAINRASAREKSIRHGHPSTLHLWWARRPLAACRAVLFAQLVDDPSAWPDRFPTEADQERERRRLFRLIEELVKWENVNNDVVLDAARLEIARSLARGRIADGQGGPGDEAVLRDDVSPDEVRRYLAEVAPPVYDPFAGGGSIPLEAQRLGLRAIASDLNPVAVLINKALIEIPPRFAGRPPVHPDARKHLVAGGWKGARGLAEDVRRYGAWMRDEAFRRIGHLYPKVRITEEMANGRDDLEPYVGQELTVIAWLWARTVPSPDPAFADVEVPLVSSFWLSKKKGKEAWLWPVVDREARTWRFEVRRGAPPDRKAVDMGTKLGRGAHFRCLLSGTPIEPDHVKRMGREGKMGARLIAIVLEGRRERLYLPAIEEHEEIARQAKHTWQPDSRLPDDPRNFWTVQYGLTTYADLFTPRQLVALTTFSDLVREVVDRVYHDALGARASGPHLGTRTAVGARASGPPLGTRTSRPPPSLDAPSPDTHKGWYSRGYHPHVDGPDLIQSVTFRLADSVPAELLAQWREELDLLEGGKKKMRAGGPRTQEGAQGQPGEAATSQRDREIALRRRIERYEDAGHGACWLRDPRVATLVEQALLHFDGERYRLLEWCIMPNHVHVLLQTLPGFPLADIVRSWKTYTAREANRLLGRRGRFWMPDYFDRFIRDDRHLAVVGEYIRANPVEAGLCEEPAQWRWSSAWWRARGGDARQRHAHPGWGVSFPRRRAAARRWLWGEGLRRGGGGVFDLRC